MEILLNLSELIVICSACDQGSPIAQVQAWDHATIEDLWGNTKEDGVEATAAESLTQGLINSEDHIVFLAWWPNTSLEIALIDRMIND